MNQGSTSLYDFERKQKPPAFKDFLQGVSIACYADALY